MKPFDVEGVPPPAGHYSHAVVHDRIVYVSGQLPLRNGGLDLVGAPVEEQTAQAIENLRLVLETSGSGLDCVIKTTVYVADVALWGRVNQSYAAAFGERKPARSIVPTGPLHHGFLVEVEAIAYVQE